MQIDFWNGSSSLLFLISSVISIYCSKSFLWKVSNGLLVISSFLCNSTNNIFFLFFDYGIISVLSITYLDNSLVWVLFGAVGLIEIRFWRSIEKTKNVSFILAISKSCHNTYLFVGKYYFYLILSSSLLGTLVYVIRYLFHSQLEKRILFFLTYLWHFCVVNILCISSYSI